MRYRALDANGDYTFGQGQANFLVNSPAAVAQLVATRLRLWTGEWFLDVTDGTPWLQDVIGKGTGPIYDLAIQQRILGTQGVTSINGYSSSLNRATRKLAISVTELVTIYGKTPFGTVI